MSKKTALITGGSRGIGRQCVLHFARQGYQVIFNYNANEPKELMETLDEEGLTYLCLKADLSVEDEVKALVKIGVDTFGNIDVLLNNAGITKDTLMLRMTKEDFENVIDVNLVGTFLMVKEVSKVMMKARTGSIINVSSVVGLRGNAGQVNYAASKSGIIGLTKSVAKELSGRGITCNAIAPGFIETEMTDKLSDKIKENILGEIPLKRFGIPQDVAELAFFLAGEQSRYITGQVIAVDGGMSM